MMRAVTMSWAGMETTMTGSRMVAAVAMPRSWIGMWYRVGMRNRMWVRDRDRMRIWHWNWNRMVRIWIWHRDRDRNISTATNVVAAFVVLRPISSFATHYRVLSSDTAEGHPIA
jgi:hypothetical protein